MRGFPQPLHLVQRTGYDDPRRRVVPLASGDGMNVLVTAGNTLALIDKVRCITNIFTGRTGAAIALEAHARGHTVTLVTSHPEAVVELAEHRDMPGKDRFVIRRYSTFEDLQSRMCETISPGGLDAVVHCAAVSDYLARGIYSPGEGTWFDPSTCRWYGEPTVLIARQAGKVKSDEPEMWIRLVRAPKLVDRVRTDWGFQGILVKFKLEVGLTDEQLLDVAERSRAHSAADLMVANTLEGAPYYAFIGARAGNYERVSRGQLARRLLEVVEQKHAGD